MGIMEDGQLMGYPRNGVALPTPRTVLDEIALSRSMLTGMGYQTSHRVELVIPGEDHMMGASLPSFLVLVLDDMNEMLDQVEDTVSRPDLFPEIRRRKTL